MSNSPRPVAKAPDTNPSRISLEPPLRALAPAGFSIGTTAPTGGHLGTGINPFEQNDKLRYLIGSQFSSLTPENQAKMEELRRSPNVFDYAALDRVVEFAEDNDMRLRGHALLWHRQVPPWLEAGIANGTVRKDDLRAFLRDHIATVLSRYAGRIHDWDVANEVIDEDGSWRQDNPFIAVLGPEIISDAFRWAHEADPNARLFLNDYGIEWDNAKFNKYLTWLPELLADGVPVHAVGFQGHISIDEGGFPPTLRQNMQRIADLGVDVEITELNIRIPKQPDGTVLPHNLDLQANWFARAVAESLAVDRCTGITVWGIGDEYSWVSNEFPGTGAATPFDHQLQPKDAFAHIRDTLAQSSGTADQLKPGTTSAPAPSQSAASPRTTSAPAPKDTQRPADPGTTSAPAPSRSERHKSATPTTAANKPSASPQKPA